MTWYRMSWYPRSTTKSQTKKRSRYKRKPSPRRTPKKDAEESDEEETPAPKNNKANKVVSEKESPKKKTGYAYFCSINRERVKNDNPDMKAQDLTRELARL